MSYRRSHAHGLDAFTGASVLITFLIVCTSGCGEHTTSVPSNSGPQIQQGTEIQLSDGSVQGEIDGGTRRFLGIPFAAPPLGELRWRPPQPPAPWDGVRATTEFASPCPQTASINGMPSQDEDCLYLNVWTPDPAPTRPLPVMVWFHGGGNTSGSAADLVPLGLGGLFYNGRVLAETRNVIIVTTNYRLGVLGFFGHSSLTAEDPHYPYSGNQGLLDQRAALEWVRDNIGAFGGDRNNVTIFGESAGSFDTCFHVVSPGSHGLFHRAISESGGCTTHQDTVADAENAAEQLITKVGCATSAVPLQCLRQVPVSTLLGAGGSFNPIIDGAVLPDQPRALFAAGRFSRVPYILGSNSDEGTLFFIGTPPVTTEEQYLAALRDSYGDRAEQIADVYPPANFASPQDALARVVGDSGLVCPTYDSARRAAANGADVYLYNFARPIPIKQLASLKLGATHGAEIAYVFGSLDPGTDADRQIALAMQGYWTRMAYNGNPNGENAVAWPRYQDAGDQRLNFDTAISVVTGFRRTECEFWWGLYDQDFK